jgi:predicted branched-subunit amino acid permease
MSVIEADVDARTALPRPVPARSAALDGVLTMLPLLAAYIPFALVIGAAVAEHGSPVAGWSGSWLIYGGSAHLAAIRTLDEAGPAVGKATPHQKKNPQKK